MSTGLWTVDRGTLRMGEPDAVHRQWLPYHPVSLCGVGDALPAEAHGCVCLLSPDTVQSRGLIKASCDRPHLHLTSVHSNESVSEIVDVQFDGRIARLAGWLAGCPVWTGLLCWSRTRSRSAASAAFWATIVVLVARTGWVTALRPQQCRRASRHSG